MSSHIIKQLKCTENESEAKIKIYKNKLCVNECTQMQYSFMKGSNDEKSLYRVMPIDGTEKLYFDSHDEYEYWKSHRKTGKIGRPHVIKGVQSVNN